jgi:hypothetical protein
MTDVSDSRRILDLLAQGKITVDEADQLLRATGARSAPANAPVAESAPSAGNGTKPSRKWLRMTVDKAAEDGRPRRKVNIRVPISLLRGGMKIGAAIPHIASDAVLRQLRDQGINLAELSKLDLSDFEKALSDLDDTTIDVDSGRAQIRFSSE